MYQHEAPPFNPKVCRTVFDCSADDRRYQWETYKVYMGDILLYSAYDSYDDDWENSNLDQKSIEEAYKHWFDGLPKER